MAIVEDPGGELAGQHFFVGLLHLFFGHVEKGLELAGKTEKAILLECGAAHRHPGTQWRQVFGQGLGEFRGQFLSQHPFLNVLPRDLQAFQVPDMGAPDLFPDEFLEPGLLKKEFLGIGAHRKAFGHGQPQPHQVSQLFGLSPEELPFPDLRQGQDQGPRLQGGARQFLVNFGLHLLAGFLQGLIVTTGHGHQGRDQGLHLLAQSLAGAPHIMHVKQEAFVHLHLQIGDHGENGAVGG